MNSLTSSDTGNSGGGALPGRDSANTLTRRARRKKKNSKNKKERRGPKYWLAVGALSSLAACGPICESSLALASANRNVRALETITWRELAQAQTPAARFDIQAGPLDTVLNTFQRVTGLQVLVPLEAIRGIVSPGVSGMFTAEQALKQILAGTGVTYRFTKADTVTLEVSGPSESVVVTGPVAQLSSPKYSEPLRDIPQIWSGRNLWQDAVMHPA